MMPAGSGPQVGVGTNVAVGTSEVAMAVLPSSNWQEILGILLTAFVDFTASNTGNVTFRLRQGNGVAGVLLYTSPVLAVTSGIRYQASYEFVDTSAFGLAQQAGQYTLTAQSSVVTTSSVNVSILEAETIAPIQ